MFRSDSTDRWFWSEDVNVAVDFCVRALRRDGLRIPPFDRHPDGDGTLRALGLRPASWRAWLRAILARLERLDTYVRQLDPRADRDAIATVLRQLGRPDALCPGTQTLRVRLEELWTEHEPLAGAWKRAMTDGHRRPPPAEARRLWQALRSYHTRLPTLRVYLVDYPTPVVMTIPPITALIARDTAEREGSTYSRLVLTAAVELASTQASASDDLSTSNRD